MKKNLILVSIKYFAKIVQNIYCKITPNKYLHIVLNIIILNIIKQKIKIYILVEHDPLVSSCLLKCLSGILNLHDCCKPIKQYITNIKLTLTKKYTIKK